VILFLDFDGVLHPLGSTPAQCFSRSAVLLGRIGWRWMVRRAGFAMRTTNPHLVLCDPLIGLSESNLAQLRVRAQKQARHPD
jgi:hypothetical protein